MASLYKKPVMIKDPATGEKVKGKSKKWWGQYKDADGRLKRVPLAIDKAAARAMLDKIVKQVEREKAGLVDPTDEQRKRPLKEHIREYEAFLDNKGITEKQKKETISKLNKIAAARRWKFIADINAGSTLEFLGQLRRDGRSVQTYNHYLKAAKSFTRWLIMDRRTPLDPLVHVSRLNVRTDRRHDRRALSDEEFSLLIEAARCGGPVAHISGPDRAMMYILAAWTGFRKRDSARLPLRRAEERRRRLLRFPFCFRFVPHDSPEEAPTPYPASSCAAIRSSDHDIVDHLPFGRSPEKRPSAQPAKLG
jgi:hypothetical protein